MTANSLQPIASSGGQKSISDDDICARCRHCDYKPGQLSGCANQWPGLSDQDGYVQQCTVFVEAEKDPEMNVLTPGQTTGSTILIFMLADTPQGDRVIVKTAVPLRATDGDLSCEMAAGERFLTSKYYTVYGSFLESDPAASLVNLDACQLVQ